MSGVLSGVLSGVSSGGKCRVEGSVERRGVQSGEE